MPRHLDSLAERLDRDNLGLNFSPLRDARTVAAVDRLGHLMSLGLLTAVSAACGTVLVVVGQGPLIARSMPLSTYFGLVLLLMAYVLGRRLAVMALRHDRVPAR